MRCYTENSDCPATAASALEGHAGLIGDMETAKMEHAQELVGLF